MADLVGSTRVSAAEYSVTALTNVTFSVGTTSTGVITKLWNYEILKIYHDSVEWFDWNSTNCRANRSSRISNTCSYRHFQITNLMHNSYIFQQYVCYITILNMFRAAPCSSSGGQIVLLQPLVSSLSVNSVFQLDELRDSNFVRQLGQEPEISLYIKCNVR